MVLQVVKSLSYHRHHHYHHPTTTATTAPHDNYNLVQLQKEIYDLTKRKENIWSCCSSIYLGENRLRFCFRFCIHSTTLQINKIVTKMEKRNHI
ncbi:hypothetical protein C1H46_028883 [Malus baccata]|uniref:Uncharacterized protein n=1 Tax=Malus baccata TaxID=106549 RepID=A0A540LGH4_MALBA|nr:hypothetical protein C1H46_028883 [Malus baccata]